MIIFIIVRGYVNEKDKYQVYTDEKIDLKISQVKKVDDNTLDLTLKRNIGEGNFIGLSFSVTDGNKIEVVRVNSSMPENETGNFSLKFIELNASNIKKISVTPIYLDKEGEEVIGNVKDEYVAPNVCSTYCPPNAQCGTNGCGAPCGNGCAKGYSCLYYKCVKDKTSSGGSSDSGDSCKDTCSSLGYVCGEHTICGEKRSCGTCQSPLTCAPNGTCIRDAPTCTPTTCSALGRNCGTVSDGCGGTLTCGNYGGACQSGYSCQANGTCIKDDGTMKYLVQNKVGNADIVVASNAPNTVKVASKYFQMYIYNMTGVTLPISSSPSTSKQYHVYIGKSSYTDNLGINSLGCRDGGFKIISGDNYLVLIGDDTPASCPGVTNSLGPRNYAEWDTYVRNKWGESFKWTNDFIGAYSSGYNDMLDIRIEDGRGSLNAVFEFLYDQGIRWYYPGWNKYDNLGIIIPEKSNIEFKNTNVLVNPDSAMRSMAFYGFSACVISEYHLGKRAGEVLQWVLSLRLNSFYEYISGALAGPCHGLFAVIDRQWSEHPEYFATYNGVRYPAVNLCHPYYTTQNRLFEETVKYSKTIFDLYDVPIISIMPTDGFEGPSDECKNKETPRRGYDGMYSDYVWEFVNNVAWEIYNDPQYSDKIVYNSAYGNYGLPPLNLSKPLAPNLWVMVSRVDSVELHPNTQYTTEEILNLWLNLFKTNNHLTGGVETNKLISYDSYFHNVAYNPEKNLPYYMPHVISKGLKMLNRTSLFRGEFMEIPTITADNSTYDEFIVNSLNTYITARLYWNTSQNVDEIMEEYYVLFYGAAASKMKELIEYSENNYAKSRFSPTFLNTLKQKANEALALVPSNSKYYQRISLVRDLLYAP